MSARSTSLSLLQSDFPGRDRLIEQAYHHNRPFRELCDDYRKCVVALERWERLEAEETGPRRQEYAELLEDLRGEIRSWLEAMETGSYRTDGKGPR